MLGPFVQRPRTLPSQNPRANAAPMSIRSPYKVSHIRHLRHNLPVKAGRGTTPTVLIDAIEGWFLSLRGKSASPHTISRHGYVWTRFGAFLAERGTPRLNS